jgi:cytochrome oxidase Cu insertion factor (SCO1/SenC/PrrC family)
VRHSRVVAKKKKKRGGLGGKVAIGLIVVVLAAIAYMVLQTPPQPSQPPTPVPTTTVRTSERASAPDFSLQDVDGRGFRLSDFRGKVVVLEFMSTTCPHCANEAPRLAAVWKRFGSTITIISVDVNAPDTDEVLKAYAVTYDSPWVWARDTANVASAYGVSGVPTILIIDANGHIAYTHSGETSEETLTQQILSTQQ